MKEYSTAMLMKLHHFYLTHKNDPLVHCCGVDVNKRIAEIEFEMLARIPLRHLWQIECVQRDNNIMPL